MRHLKKFNEELNPFTYLSASRKLKKLGHVKRSKELESWGHKKAWEENIKKYSKFGKCNVRFTSGGNVLFSGDFYLVFTFDEDINYELISSSKNPSGYFEFSIQFGLGLIPIDEETLKVCLERFSDYFDNGFFYSNWVYLVYNIRDEEVFFNKISIYPYEYDELIVPEIYDRNSALTLKRSLMACLDENQDYPSGDDRFETMHDLVYRCICQQCEMLIDYNLDIERVFNDLKGLNLNFFFKD